MTTSSKIPLIDARGLSCPQPVLMLREAIAALATGARVVLLATDAMADIDVRVFCRRAGHRVIAHADLISHQRFDIERG